jgi:DNA modification methylase
MNVTEIKISELNAAEYNPRVISDEELSGLMESLKTFGQTENLIINTDNTLISGHQRMKAMTQLGWETAWCYRVDLDKHLEKKLNVIMNSQAISGQWDSNKLAEILFELKDDDDYTALRLNELEPLDLSLDTIEEDEAPALEDVAVSVMGEIYQCGEHRVMCGSATSLDDLTALMGGGVATMVFTDPPYNVDYSGGMHGDGTQSKRRKIENDKMASEDFYKFLFEVCTNLLLFTRGAFYICMSSSELHNLWKAFTDAGGHWQTYVIWAKHAFTLSRSDYQHKFEPILYGLTDEEVKKIEEEEGDVEALPIMYGWNKHNWYGGRKQGDVWLFDRPTKSALHPTMKPVELCAKAIMNSSRLNNVVLDTFLGSGSTLMACEQTNRKCYGMELDPRYVDVIRKRYANFIGKGEEWQTVTPRI